MNNHRLELATSRADMITDQLHLRAAAPAWSPDGNKLAFFGVEGISELEGVFSQGNGVYVVDILGAQAVNPKLLMPQDHIKNIAWSPNGHYLALEVSIPSVPSEVVVIDADNGQELSRFLGEQPAWSPDSRELVIKACRGTCGLWLVNISGQNGRTLTDNGTDSFPTWSPTDNLIAFSSQSRHNNWEIYLLDLNSGQIERVTHRPGSDTVPIFGPCGQEIYLLTDQYSDSWRLTAVRLDGSGEYLVVRDLGRTNNWGIIRPAIR
jgi:Tol biopolymer transport system component